MYTIRPRAVRPASLLLAFVLAALIPGRLGAQGVRAGVIEGRVIDSLHGQPSRGAPVQAVRLSPEPRTFASVLTDEQGRFRFDSLLAGRYWLTFSSPVLDSLEVAIPDREVTVAAGASARVDLAIPSGATLRAAVCPGLGLASGRGGLAGKVVSEGTESPLGGATVVVGWSEWKLEPGTVKVTTTPRFGSVVTDSLGRYRLCGVPTDVPLQIQVQHRGAASAVVNAVMRDSVGMLRQNLSFSAEAVADAKGDTGVVRGVRAPSVTGTAGIVGEVVGPQGRALRDVDIRIAGARGSARSDSLGRFTLSGLPAGTQMLEARRIGYTMHRMPVELRSGRVVTQRVVLDRVVSLDSIRVIARRTKYREFEEHRAQPNGMARFLDEADILRRNPFDTGDLFKAEPGFRVIGDTLVSSRGFGLSGSTCPVNVVIDGVQHMDINFVHPSDIAGVEMYRSTNGAPPQYESFCGLVIIWLKRG